MWTLLLFVSSLTAVTFAEIHYDQEKIAKLRSECGEELSIRPEDMDLLLKKHFGGVQLRHCLLKCLVEKVGFINKQGVVQLENYHEVIPEDDPFRKAIPECQHITVEKCSDASLLAKCIDRALRKLKLSKNPQL